MITNDSVRYLKLAAFATIMLGLLLPLGFAHAQAPDYALSASTPSLCVNPGVNAQSTVNVRSVVNFAGFVSLGINVDPSINNAPHVSPTSYVVRLTPEQSKSFELSITTTKLTQTRVYNIFVNALSAASFHQIIIQVAVSNDCSVGGNIVQSFGLSPAIPYLGYALGLVGAAVLLMAMLLYTRRSRLSIHA